MLILSHNCTLISHTSKVMIKSLQARLQQYVNREVPDVQAGFRKGRGTRDQIANIRWIIEKTRQFQKSIYFCFIDYAKDFDCVDHNKLWKILFFYLVYISLVVLLNIINIMGCYIIWINYISLYSILFQLFLCNINIRGFFAQDWFYWNKFYMSYGHSIYVKALIPPLWDIFSIWLLCNIYCGMK